MAEFGVIVVGVLVALAADRWNQSRMDRVLETAFLQRFEAEIREDSLVAEQYLAQLPSSMAARDSLLSFVRGGHPPPDLVATVQRSFTLLALPAPATWGEILGSSSLLVLSDPNQRGAISKYYESDRPRVESQLSNAERRGRDPFADALYPIGLFQPASSPGVPFRRIDPVAFTAVPGMEGLLLGLGSFHGVQAVFAGQAIAGATSALASLR